MQAMLNSNSVTAKQELHSVSHRNMSKPLISGENWMSANLHPWQSQP